ncbi:MAG: O-antigen ligase family protein [Deltaproteobacteria bacterium]|nr:O-antigen ligase family protein [Deltaproteobacteria bacterium]
MKAALWTAFMICLISIIYRSFGVDLLFLSQRPPLSSATFGNYKFAGEYLTPLIFWSLGLFCSEKKKWEKRIFLFLTLFFIFSLFFIYNSRASIIALLSLLPLLSIIFFSDIKNIFYNRKLKIAAALILLIFLSFSIWFSQATQQGRHTLGVLKTIVKPTYSTNEQRLTIWNNTLHMGKDHLWRGVGMGNFNLVYPLYESREDRYYMPVDNEWELFVRQTHNEYLQLFSELGLFGMALFMLVFYGIGKTAYAFIQKNSPKNSKERLFVCLFFSFLCSGIIAFFGFNLQNTASSFFFMATTAFLIKMATPADKIIFLKHWVGKLVLIPVMFFLLFFSPKPMIRSFMAIFYQLQGQSFMKVHDFRAIQSFEKSLWWDPHDWETHFLIGKNYGDHFLFPQAIKHLRTSLALNPTYVSTFYNLGVYFEQSKDGKDRNEAKQMYQRLLAIAPDFRKAHIQLGHIALSQHQMEEAQQHFEQALLPAAYQQSEQAGAHLGLILVYIQQRKYKKMTKEFFEAYLLNPRMEEPHFKYWLQKIGTEN